ncbi:MAG: type II toxin-antitoxin system RelB/DinJ family antitoxin [Clostridia bacterium]|nr:type II toxin-antitoxin system RelB/DinJ family antitoxin [Clostridia bacterium]
MATKTANVSVRVQPEIKAQAEEILAQLGIPVSVLIDSLYRQIIMTNRIPYSFSLPTIQTRDTMTEEQFNAMMAKGLDEAKSGRGVSVDDAFEKINQSIGK